MNFLFDENIPKRLAKWLKDKGHNSITLQKLKLLGIKNGSVAKLAIQENAIILTCDRDFIQMKKRLQNKLQVIYFNLEIPNFENIRGVLSANLDVFLEYLDKPGAILVKDDKIEYIPVG